VDQSKSKIKELAAGDLVTHVLYGKEWVGIILEFKEGEESSPESSSRNEKALVQIQPGTKFEGFFKSKVSEENRVNDSLGYVTTNWLFKIEIKNEKTRSSRSEARKSGRKSKKVF